MYFDQLIEKIEDFQGRGALPYASFWPNSFSLPTAVTNEANKMSRWTKDDKIEYETSVFDIDGSIVATPLLRGTRYNVNSRHTASVNYKPTQDNKMLIQEILLDGRIYSRKTIQIPPKPFKPYVKFLFSIHSHPVHEGKEGKDAYSFFSGTDLNTLISSTGLCLGLVTNEIWVACKTDRTLRLIGGIGEDVLSRVSGRSIFDGEELKKLIKEEIGKWGIIFYRGQFGGRLSRVN